MPAPRGGFTFSNRNEAGGDGKITDAYGARMVGRNMARRVSFLIGLDGKVAHVTDNMSAEAHLTEMKDAVAKVKGKGNP